jgi:retinol-binding protein 3
MQVVDPATASARLTWPSDIDQSRFRVMTKPSTSTAALLVLLLGASITADELQLPNAPADSVADSAAAPATDPITPAQRRDVLDRLVDLVERNYVMADTARMISAHLRARDIAGDYDEITTVAHFAEALTTGLRAVNGDRHLYVSASGPGEPSGRSHAEPAPTEGPAAIGFTRVERLDGDVGYIELGGVLGSRRPDPRRDDALMAEIMSAMEGAGAVILDLRRAPGGSAFLANQLVSHFLPPGVHLLTVDSRRSGTMVHRLTDRAVPGPRLLDVPLYVLISMRSFSAAEDIAFALQSQERATLVGERTGGGGRNNLLASLGHGLTVSISNTRVLDPRTGEEAWERRGVSPDIAVPADEALGVALRLARAAGSR